MGKIYIVGLGPGSIDDLTKGAIDKIRDNKINFVRTKCHPTIKYFTDNNIEFQKW